MDGTLFGTDESVFYEKIKNSSELCEILDETLRFKHPSINFDKRYPHFGERYYSLLLILVLLISK